jgi:hypothetical protein
MDKDGVAAAQPDAAAQPIDRHADRCSKLTLPAPGYPMSARTPPV